MSNSVSASALPRRLVTLAGLLLALGPVSLPFYRWDHEFADTAHLVGNEAIWWVYIGLVLAYVLRVERLPLASIGLRRIGVKDAGIALLAGVGVTAALAFLYFVVFPVLHWDIGTKFDTLLATPFWWRLISTVRAAVSEEVLFRGYAIERLQTLTGSRVVASLVSCAIFTLDHVPAWGWQHVLIAGTGGIAFTLLYLWRRNLGTNIIAHFIVDAMAVL